MAGQEASLSQDSVMQSKSRLSVDSRSFISRACAGRERTFSSAHLRGGCCVPLMFLFVLVWGEVCLLWCVVVRGLVRSSVEACWGGGGRGAVPMLILVWGSGAVRVPNLVFLVVMGVGEQSKYLGSDRFLRLRSLVARLGGRDCVML